MMGSFRTPPSKMDRSKNQKSNADITEFNRPNNQLNIFDIYKGLYSKTEDYAFL